MNVIYKRLPEELQIKILYFVKREIYERRYVKKIRNILHNKINRLFYKSMNNYKESRLRYYVILNERYILYIYGLYNKYNQIIYEKYKNLLLKIIEIISTLVNHTNNLVSLGIEKNEYNKLKSIYNIIKLQVL